MIEVVNRQRQLKIDVKVWERFAGKALSEIDNEPHDATIAFVSNRTIRDLNRRFRGLNKDTDVLSFPADAAETGNLGDIAISLEQARIQARANGLKFEQEVAQLILHGLLHLCGYDHETDNGEMDQLEIRLRRKLRI
jgi:probable rRNA maturation factor